MDGITVGQYYVNAQSHLYGRLVLIDEASGIGFVACRDGDILRWPLSQLIHIAIYDKDFFVFPIMSFSPSQRNTAVNAYLLMRRLSSRSQSVLTHQSFNRPRLFSSNHIIDSYPVGACEFSGGDWVAYLDKDEHQLLSRCESHTEAIEHLWAARLKTESTSIKRKSS